MCVYAFWPTPSHLPTIYLRNICGGGPANIGGRRLHFLVSLIYYFLRTSWTGVWAMTVCHMEHTHSQCHWDSPCTDNCAGAGRRQHYTIKPLPIGEPCWGWHEYMPIMDLDFQHPWPAPLENTIISFNSSCNKTPCFNSGH